MKPGPFRAVPAGLVRPVGQRFAVSLRRWAAGFHQPRSRPIIDVSIADRRRAHAIARLLATATDHRIRALGADPPACLVILVDHTIADDDACTARLDLLEEPDRPARYLLHLALAHHNTPRPLDALVADLNRLLLVAIGHQATTRLETLSTAHCVPSGPLATSAAWDRLLSAKGASRDGSHDLPRPRRHDA
jgi:hypothetical protein